MSSLFSLLTIEDRAKDAIVDPTMEYIVLTIHLCAMDGVDAANAPLKLGQKSHRNSVPVDIKQLQILIMGMRNPFARSHRSLQTYPNGTRIPPSGYLSDLFAIALTRPQDRNTRQMCG